MFICLSVQLYGNLKKSVTDCYETFCKPWPKEPFNFRDQDADPGILFWYYFLIIVKQGILAWQRFVLYSVHLYHILTRNQDLILLIANE